LCHYCPIFPTGLETITHKTGDLFLYAGPNTKVLSVETRPYWTGICSAKNLFKKNFFIFGKNVKMLFPDSGNWIEIGWIKKDFHTCKRPWLGS